MKKTLQSDCLASQATAWHLSTHTAEHEEVSLTACLSSLQRFGATKPQKQLILGIISLFWGEKKKRLLGPSIFNLSLPQEPNTRVVFRDVFNSYRRVAITALQLLHPAPVLCSSAFIVFVFLCWSLRFELLCAPFAGLTLDLAASKGIEVWVLQMSSVRRVNITVQLLKPTTSLISGGPQRKLSTNDSVSPDTFALLPCEDNILLLLHKLAVVAVNMCSLCCCALACCRGRHWLMLFRSANRRKKERSKVSWITQTQPSTSVTSKARLKS